MKALFLSFLVAGFAGVAGAQTNSNKAVLKPLKAGKLAEAVGEIASEWLDNNISNGGHTYLTAVAVSAAAAKDLEAAAGKQFLVDYKKFVSKKVKGLKPSTAQGAYDKQRAEEIIDMLMLSNAYDSDNKEAKSEFATQLKQMQQSLGKPGDLVVASAKKRVTVKDGDDTRDVEMALYIIMSSKTRQAIEMFLVEGTI